ncbi:MAG TPA: ATP-binding protein [Anaerolineae bacterium]|nr:ATP-binding protein [Anaerolineae bacterium]
MPHVFERLYRGRHASQLDTPGSGLGLAIVKVVVHLHRGMIEVESDVGKVSTFGVWLPVERGEAVL